MNAPPPAAPTAVAPVALPPEYDEHTVFRSLFTAYPDSLLLVDQGGRIVLANPAAAALLGYPVDELVGLNVDALVPDATRPRHATYRAAYAKTPRPRPMATQMELVARRKDGAEVMVEIALSPLQSQGLPYVVAAIRDIGAYPRVQQALQRARYSEHLAKLGRMAVDARDRQVLLHQVSAIAAEALQVEVATVYLVEGDRLALRVASSVGAVSGEAVGARIAHRPDTSIGCVLASGKPVVVPEYRREQRFTVPRAYLDAGLTSALVVPLQDRGRTVGALAVRARTPQRFGDEEMRFVESLASLLATSLQRAQSEDALNHAQRLESVGQLTGGIAHDFNNLLTVIQGNLQVLEESAALADQAHCLQLVSAAARATRRGAELTNKLLAFSRRQLLQPSTIDVNTLLRSLADMLRRTVDQRIRIEVDVSTSCPPVLADPGQLESALLNIAINARDAMPDGGTLRFRGEASLVLPTEVRRSLDDPSAVDEGFVAIAVSDSGVGMSDEVKERAFEPFFTTKAAGRGTGLGLSTVYGFVKQSRGAIAIDSAPGAGTTITLYLPQPWQDDAAGAAEPDADGTVPAGLHVLLVEDDADVRSVVRSFLQTLGCRVTDASSGEEAVLSLGPDADFDLLLTDIALGPGMRGTQLAQAAQERLPRLAVLLMSGFSSELLDADRDSPAAWELLRKPYTRSELARAMARVIGAR